MRGGVNGPSRGSLAAHSRRGERGAHGAADPRVVAALQAALAAEQAASYGYGIVGSHLTSSARQFAAATADAVAHERARDSLAAMITELGATPRPAAVAYRLPITVGTPAQAVSLAVLLERQVEAAYLGLVAVPGPGLRSFGARQITAAAVRCARWSGHSQAFPGLPRSSGR
jgi:uncharacterized protein DUF4439